VRVPCSTSNLGPGFDLLGLALSMHLEVTARVADGANEHVLQHRGEERPDAPAEDDLVVRALRAFERRFHAELPPLAIEARSEIPVGRGFGSSGAAVAAGLLVGAAAAGREDLLGDRAGALAELAVELEGHPDNAVASLLGGCTLSCPVEAGGGAPARLRVVRQPVHASLGFALAWPSRPTFTEEARAALPGSVPLADAIENPRRLALLLEGLRTGDAGLLRDGVHDRLHERFRRALVPGADGASAAAIEAGAFAACMSGAGSGLVAIGRAGAMEPVAEALAAPLEGGRARVVALAAEAPAVSATAG